MSARDFIGFAVLVTLQNPSNAQLQGTVANVIDHSLHLTDVTLLWSGQRIPNYIVKSFLIADLDVLDARTAQPAEADGDLQTPTAPPAHNPAHTRLPPSQPSSFVDPAILSFSKPRHVPPNIPAQAVPQPSAVSPVMIADGEVPSPAQNAHQQLGEKSSVSSLGNNLPARKMPSVAGRRDSSATLTEPFDAMALGNENALPGIDETKNAAANSAKKTRQRGSRKPKEVAQNVPGLIAMKDITNGPVVTKPGTKGKGWRQTPLVEEVPISKRKSRRARNQQLEDLNGWATEDATDIQDMGDFDFESNLSKFDKRQVFNEIRREDLTADDDRLVSFNRKAKPGTNGGRNLHFTENVLESEAGETEEELREEHYSSGRGSKRAGSKRPPQSRKGSTFLAISGLRTESPRPLARVGTASPLNGSISGVRHTFRMAKTNALCQCISPLQMVEIEQLCTSELGLTEDMLTENAGRSIAEAVLRAEQSKTILLLVGNHKSGARAVAAARHLRNRRLRVTVCVLGGEREETLLEHLRKQLAIYKKSGGYVDRWDEFQAKTSAGPQPDVIVDALLGMHLAFDELRTDDQATAFEMIRWAKRNAAPVVSIDVPSGLSASTGVISEPDGEALVMASKHVVCLAAPKIGLAAAVAEISSDWQIFVADIGVSSAAWQRHSRRKQGVDFGSDWVVVVKASGGSA